MTTNQTEAAPASCIMQKGVPQSDPICSKAKQKIK
jgi:hypothetical protein